MSNQGASEKPSAKNEYETCFLEALGEGNSKKISKKNSAVEMLKILKEKFEALFMISAKKSSRHVSQGRNQQQPASGEQQTNTAEIGGNNATCRFVNRHPRKNKAKNIVKIKKTNPDYGKGSINPISRLMQIQQAKKDDEPEFTLVTSSNTSSHRPGRNNRTEFIIQCSLTRTIVQATPKSDTNNNSNSEPVVANAKQVEKLQCEGKGSTKKLAKQNAAEAMLVKLGYQPKALKPSIKTTTTSPTVVASSTASVSNPNSTETVVVPHVAVVATTIAPVEPEANSDSGASGEKSNADKLAGEKNEKRVTFVEDNNVTIEISDNSASLGTN